MGTTTNPEFSGEQRFAEKFSREISFMNSQHLTINKLNIMGITILLSTIFLFFVARVSISTHLLSR